METGAFVTDVTQVPFARPAWYEREPLHSILESAREAFVSIDSAGTVIAWNQAAEETFGWRREEAYGRAMAELLIPERDHGAHHRDVRRLLETGGDGLPARGVERTALHSDGHEITVELTMTPMHIGGATVVNAFFRDVGDRLGAEQEIRRLAATVDLTDDAVMSWTLDGTITSWNSGAERLYGRSPDEMVGESIARMRPTADLEEFRALQARLERGESVRDLEIRETSRDGSFVDVSVSMQPLTDESGRVTGISSVARDMTATRASERALREAHGRFRGAFEAAPIGMALVALDGALLSVNSALCDLLARSEMELTELDLQSVTHPEDIDLDRDQSRRLTEGESDRYEIEKRYLRPDGAVAWGLLCVSLVRDADGKPVHFVAQIQDITGAKESEEQLRQHLERLTELALKDSLTGLRNERDFQAAVDREVQRMRRHGGEFSVVLLDIDGFGELNERVGRTVGDSVLRGVATAVSAVCRGSDVPARLRDDEFALLLPETTAEGAEAAVARVRAALEGVEHDVSLSYGIASGPADGDSGASLLLRAAAALAAVQSHHVPAEEQGLGVPHRARGPVTQLLALAREQLDMDVAFLGELVDGREVIRAVAGDGAALGLDTGGVVTVPAAYRRRMVEGEVLEVIPDTSAELEVAELAVTGAGGAPGAYVGVPLRLSDGCLYGALCVVSNEARPDLSKRSADLLRFLAGLIAESLDQVSIEERERRAQVELSGIQSLVAALEARDHYTGEHSKIVVQIALGVAERLGLSDEEVLEVEQVAILHDVGKVGIPDALLQKRGPLTDEEWLVMRQHPAVGERIVASTESLSHLARAMRAEHERFDGMGYPDGLRGEDIPIASRICLACDAYHAMTSERPYRAGMSAEEVQEQLVANAGTQFDPRIVDALLIVIAGL